MLLKRTLKWITAAVCFVLAAVLLYVLYVLVAYHRLADMPLEIGNRAQAQVQTQTVYTAVSWNIGFGAYSSDFSFFMDGGDYARAFSEQAVLQNIDGVCQTLRIASPDFIFLQETDVKATRSFGVDQHALILGAFEKLSHTFAVNYDSPYLFYPLTQPHGKSLSGMLAMARFQIDSSLRRQLPVERGWRKFLDLDRCYNLIRFPVGDRQLCIYHVHLSAYTADGQLATEQLKLLLADMETEAAKGNHVLCAGDFNKDLLGDSAARFGTPRQDDPWAQPFPTELLPEGFSLAAPFDAANPVPSCRNADAPYAPGESFVVTVDGFIVGPTVKILSCTVIDTAFGFSDHNPVQLMFYL